MHKIIDEVESFIKSNVSEKLAKYECDIETYQKSLAKLTKKRKDVEQAIGKLKEDVATQEIKKREMLDNVILRETKETMETLKEQYRQLNVQLKNMNYDEAAKKWKQLEDERQATLRQVSDTRLSYIACTLINNMYDRIFFFQRNVSLGKQEELERVIKQYTQELRKEDYRLARRNYTNKCIELTVKYYMRSSIYFGLIYVLDSSIHYIETRLLSSF